MDFRPKQQEFGIRNSAIVIYLRSSTFPLKSLLALDVPIKAAALFFPFFWAIFFSPAAPIIASSTPGDFDFPANSNFPIFFVVFHADCALLFFSASSSSDVTVSIV